MNCGASGIIARDQARQRVTDLRVLVLGDLEL